MRAIVLSIRYRIHRINQYLANMRGDPLAAALADQAAYEVNRELARTDIEPIVQVAIIVAALSGLTGAYMLGVMAGKHSAQAEMLTKCVPQGARKLLSTTQWPDRLRCTYAEARFGNPHTTDAQ